MVAIIYLFLKTEAADLREKNEILSVLRELKGIDSQWDLDVLRARSNLTPAVGMRTHHAHNASRALKRVALVAWNTNSHALNQGVPGLEKAFARKAELMDAFWQESSGARRALQAGLRLTQEAEERVSVARRIVPRWKAQAARAAIAARELAASLLRFHHSPGNTQQRALNDAAGKFLNAADQMSAPLRDIADGMTLEIQRLYQFRPAEEQLYTKLTYVTAGPRVDSLTGALSHEVERTLAEKERFRVYLVFTALAFLVSIVFLGIRLRMSKTELERRLGDRERELSDALARLNKSGEP